MPAPSVATYSAAAKITAHTGFLGLVDAGTAGSIRIRSAADVLLAESALTYPGGTVDGMTGQLTLTPAASETAAVATGLAAYAEVCASDGTVHLALPAVDGTQAAAGSVVLNTLTIVAGAPVAILSATIG